MNVLQASGELYNWFSENDSFCMDEDFMKIIPITEHPKRDRAAVFSALSDLEESKLIASSEVDGKQYWIIRKNFLSYNQSVEITPELSLSLAKIINKFCELTGEETEYCDPVNIEEKDLKNLIYIANILLTDKKELDSKTELD